MYTSIFIAVTFLSQDFSHRCDYIFQHTVDKRTWTPSRHPPMLRTEWKSSHRYSSKIQDGSKFNCGVHKIETLDLTPVRQVLKSQVAVDCASVKAFNIHWNGYKVV